MNLREELASTSLPKCPNLPGQHINLAYVYANVYTALAVTAGTPYEQRAEEEIAALGEPLAKWVGKYILYCCAGEARHAPNKVLWIDFPSGVLGELDRWRGFYDPECEAGPSRVRGAESFLKDRDDPIKALVDLEKLFSYLPWDSSYGGPSWGYIASVGRWLLTNSFTAFPEAMMMLDEIAHMRHTSSPIFASSKFPQICCDHWNFMQLVRFKAVAQPCCWRAWWTLHPGQLVWDWLHPLLWTPTAPKHALISTCSATSNSQMQEMGDPGRSRQQDEYEKDAYQTQYRWCNCCDTLRSSPHCRCGYKCPICSRPGKHEFCGYCNKCFVNYSGTPSVCTRCGTDIKDYDHHGGLKCVSCGEFFDPDEEGCRGCQQCAECHDTSADDETSPEDEGE